MTPLGPDFREVVAAKRDGRAISPDDLRSFVLAYARDEVPDYLASAFLMAAYLRGLDEGETSAMTRAMVESGSTLPMAGVSTPKVDKHSTGGVSDGVTLVFAPLAASLGMAVAKLSGRGLGHTGGTLDKLESIPGLRVDLSPAELERQVEDVGCAVAGQSKDLVPADGKLYALRDATATVASVPLIAASVMSKKLAVGTDLILLDVKAGNGAFMKTPPAAAELASACVRIAAAWDRPARAAVTDMSQPLGSSIGNAIEIAEAVRLLQGREGGRLRDLAIAFAAEALFALRGMERGEGRAAAAAELDSGRAAERFGRMVEAQGGDPRVAEDPWSVLPTAPITMDVPAPAEGYVAEVDAEAMGRAAAMLGAGRARKGDIVDPAVGIEVFPKIGDEVQAGQIVAVIHARDQGEADEAARAVLGALHVGADAVDPPPLVFGWYGDAAVGGREPEGR